MGGGAQSLTALIIAFHDLRPTMHLRDRRPPACHGGSESSLHGRSDSHLSSAEGRSDNCPLLPALVLSAGTRSKRGLSLPEGSAPSLMGTFHILPHRLALTLRNIQPSKPTFPKFLLCANHRVNAGGGRSQGAGPGGRVWSLCAFTRIFSLPPGEAYEESTSKV